MTCMGLWGNALNWEQLAWYHNVAKVPIYFSHELTTEEMAEMIEHETYTCSELHIFDAHFLNLPYDSFAIEKAIGIISDGQPSGACTSANQTFESCTAYSSSRSQGHTEMREPCSGVALAQALDRLRDGYHNYEWEEDLFPGWHADVSSHFGRTVDRHRVSLVEAPQVAAVHLPLERWGHVFQVHDESILSNAQGTWCFVHAEKDDERFTHQKFITWYDRTLLTVIHFTLPGTLAFPSGYVLSNYHIKTYSALPPPWRVYTSADGAGQTLHQSLPLQWMYRRFEDSHSAGHTPPASDMTLLPFMDNPLNH
ncbi:hypothetical protein EV421DRAFT_1905938 [Armillaria borealis]|uniref:Uncharacterized protein n=1 Tax=Armillaria borealis TaxID=47425 RepID=A0AA39JCS0_9AGAR|nr:hypothetical protein EV421DRAFT_1905938 [Armillaria borealis]